jgi:arabinose-5-phosphate isomerase
MKSFDETQRIAQSVLENEASAIQQLRPCIDQDFYEAVTAIYQSEGRVVITGIGKSAIIANKIVATLNSTGTRAMFMHAADAVHGDIGMVQASDVVIAISKSGNTPEIKVLAPLLRQSGNTFIAMVGQKDSNLGRQADYCLQTPIEAEACPNNLAPTTSTTAQLAMGDALAVSLIEFRSFTEEDFARYHPGGTLGKQLYLKAGDLYHDELKPAVSPDASLKDVIVEISTKRLGATVVMHQETMQGVITDGDLRRMLSEVSDISSVKAGDIMTPDPQTIQKDELAVKARDIMREDQVSQLIVMDEAHYLGMLHIHDLNREGLL